MDFNRLKELASKNSTLKYDLLALYRFIWPNIADITDVNLAIEYFKGMYKESSNDFIYLTSVHEKFEFFEEFFPKIVNKHNLKTLFEDADSTNFIILYPNHYAVAIRYNKELDCAPIVIAKGDRQNALDIICTAHFDTLIIEDHSLASSLFFNIDIGSEISEDFYVQIAEAIILTRKLK